VVESSFLCMYTVSVLCMHYFVFCPSLQIFCTDNPSIIIYFTVIYLFLAGITETISEKLSLIPSVTVLCNYFQ
jgi:hypothetical protein